MNIHYQNWEPDTCGCKVEEQIDTDIPNSEATMSKVISKCEHHQGVDDSQLYDGSLGTQPN